MSLLLLIAILGGIYYLSILKHGKLDFWKLAAKHPQEAWDFFSNNESWYIGSPPKTSGYIGPYMIENPYTHEWVKVYCIDTNTALKTQDNFIKKFNA